MINMIINTITQTPDKTNETQDQIEFESWN